MNYYKYLILITISVKSFSQNLTNHIPWELDGANERIDNLRKGNLTLKFILQNENQKSINAKIKVKLKSHKFNFGVSMTQSRALYGSTDFKLYQKRVKDIFNFTTVGFYWAMFDEKKNLDSHHKYMSDNINWAVNNNIKIKGHPLLWHESLPKWVINYKNMDELDKIIKKRITNLILDNPEIDYWDVYNEPVAPFKAHVNPSGITRWIEYKGGINSAMKYLYKLTESIDSSKIYTNNHYAPRDKEFMKINQYFIDEKINFQAIGMQAHMQTEDGILSEDDLWSLMQEYSKFKKDIQFTEITVTSSKRFNNWKDHQVFLAKRDNERKLGKNLTLKSLPEYEEFQAKYLKDFYTLAFSHPSVTSITLWNLTDKNAWRGHAGGILYDNLEPKKAYLELKRLIKKDWSTDISSSHNMQNKFNFRGFYGSYIGEVKYDGITYNFEFNHQINNDTIVITLN